MSASKDAFADLFAPKKNDLSKLSLAERQKLSAAGSSGINFSGSNGNSWSNLDILAGRSKANSATSSTPNSGRSTPNNAVYNAATFNNNILTPQKKSVSGSNSQSNSSNTSIAYSINGSSSDVNNVGNVKQDLDDDIFGFGLSNNNNNTNIPAAETSQPSGDPQSGASAGQVQDIDSLFAVFNNAPAAPPADNNAVEQAPQPNKQGQSQHSAPQYRSLHQNNVERERSLSRSSLPNARRTFIDNNGDDEDMFSQSQLRQHGQHQRQQQWPQQSKNHNNKDVHRLFDDIAQKAAVPEDLNHMVNELSNELFTSATSFLNKGKQVLNKNFEKYQAQRKAEVNGRPAWMYQQDRYKKKGNWSEEADDGDAIDFDGTILKQGKGSVISQSQPKPGKFFEPPEQKREQRQPQPRDEIRRGSPLSSSKSRQGTPSFASVSPQIQSPKPVTQTQQNGKLLNIFDDLSINDTKVPLVNSARATAPPRRQAFSVVGSHTEPNIDQASLMRFNQYRTLGSNFFKEGNFSAALLNYQDAFELLPYGHSLQILAYSNLATSYGKLGDAKNAIESAEGGLKLINSTNRSLEEEVEAGKRVKDFYIKLVTKKAENLESLERYPEALQCWKLALENGGATKAAIDAKRRCMEAINPSLKSKSTGSLSVRRTGASKAATGNGEALRRVRENNAKQENLEQEKYLLYDKVEGKINQWKHGKEDNIRALLASLDSILWPEANWKKISLTDLVMDKKVKVNYMKAVAKTHPDKVNQNASTEQQLIAQGVFVTLNKAWDIFKQQNNL